MNQALRLHDDANLLIRHAEQPVRFYDFQTFVEHGRGINGHLPAHIPCGMFQAVRQRDFFQLLPGLPAERAARCRQDQAVDAFPVLSQKRLEYGAVLTVYRTDQDMPLIGRSRHKTAPGDKRFLIGKGNLLSLPDRFQRRRETRKTDDSDNGHIHVRSFHRFSQRVLPCDDLRRSAVFLTENFPRFRISHRDAVRAEFFRLPQKQINIFSRRQHRRMKTLFMETNDVQRLRADRTGAAQYRDFFHQKLLINSKKAVISGATKRRLSKRSIIPPCPGRIFPESLISHTLFI